MYSFYGGKQGRTYNIVARYDTLYINFDDYSSLATTAYNAGDQFKFNGKLYKVLENLVSESTATLPDGDIVEIQGMVNKFQQGGSYTDVNYGEYVLIDTILNENHYNDELNGLLYRRGFDYNEAAPTVKRPTKEDKDEQDNWIYYQHEDPEDPQSQLIFNEQKWIANWRRYIQRPGGGAEYIGQIVGPQGNSPELQGITWETFMDTQPPTTSHIVLDRASGTTQDDIQFGWITLKDLDGNVYGAQIAFNIPYTVIEMDVPYGEQQYHATITENQASTGHNFYYKWDLSVPQIKQFKVEQDQGTSAYKLNYYIENTTAAGATAVGGGFDWTVIKEIKSNNKDGKQYVALGTSEVEKGQITRHEAINEQQQVINYYLICTESGSFPSDYFDRLPEDFQFGEGISVYVDGCVTWLCTENLTQIESLKDNNLHIQYKDLSFNDVPFNQIDQIVQLYGIIYVAYTTDEIYTLHEIGKIKDIETVQFDSNLDTEQKFHVNYGDQTVYNSEGINVVTSINKKGDIFIVLYSNQTYRQSFILDPDKHEGTDYYLLPYNGTGAGPDVHGDTWDGESEQDPTQRVFVWVSVGSLGSQFHVFGDYTKEEVLTYIPEGFGESTAYNGEISEYIDEKDREGWIISITTPGATISDPPEDVSLYAYDYNAYFMQGPASSENHTNRYLAGTITGSASTVYTWWYKLKDLDEMSIEANTIVALGSTAQVIETLISNGLGFIETTQNHSHY